MTQPPRPTSRPTGPAAEQHAARATRNASDERGTDETTSIEPVPGVADPSRGARPRPTFAYQDSPSPARSAHAPPGSAVLTTPVGGRPSRRPAARRARLTLTRVDPWSVLKAALVFSTCLLVVWMIAVIVTYGILSGAGVFDSINSNLSDALGTKINFNGPVILGGALVLGAFNVVLLSALATVAAFAYNITVGLIGGIDVTLAERD